MRSFGETPFLPFFFPCPTNHRALCFCTARPLLLAMCASGFVVQFLFPPLFPLVRQPFPPLAGCGLPFLFLRWGFPLSPASTDEPDWFCLGETIRFSQSPRPSSHPRFFSPFPQKVIDQKTTPLITAFSAMLKFSPRQLFNFPKRQGLSQVSAGPYLQRSILSSLVSPPPFQSSRPRVLFPTAQNLQCSFFQMSARFSFLLKTFPSREEGTLFASLHAEPLSRSHDLFQSGGFFFFMRPPLSFLAIFFQQFCPSALLFLF